MSTFFSIYCLFGVLDGYRFLNRRSVTFFRLMFNYILYVDGDVIPCRNNKPQRNKSTISARKKSIVPKERLK